MEHRRVSWPLVDQMICLPLVAVMLAALFAPSQARAAFEDAHAHHRNAGDASSAGPSPSAHDYAIPAVRLMRQDGIEVSLPEELNDGRAVVMNFIFTSCSAICPMMAQVFAQAQGKLGKQAEKVHLVSISIDPEYDTPERLAAYAKRFGAGPGWQFYTGTQRASVEVQKAFGAYRGDKMNHVPLALIRIAPGKPWIRLEGFVTPAGLIAELQRG
jgi:protein SCO1